MNCIKKKIHPPTKNPIKASRVSNILSCGLDLLPCTYNPSVIFLEYAITFTVSYNFMNCKIKLRARNILSCDLEHFILQ